MDNYKRWLESDGSRAGKAGYHPGAGSGNGFFGEYLCGIDEAALQMIHGNGYRDFRAAEDKSFGTGGAHFGQCLPDFGRIVIPVACFDTGIDHIVNGDLLRFGRLEDFDVGSLQRTLVDAGMAGAG